MAKEKQSAGGTATATVGARELVIRRTFDAPRDLVWAAWTERDRALQWWGPRDFDTPVLEMDVRPGGIFSIDIAGENGQDFPNLGCFLDVVPMERLVWTSMLFPGYRPAVFDDVPITAIVTMESKGTGTRYVFTALHRDEADLEKNKTSGWQEGPDIALDQIVAHVKSLRRD